MTGVALAHCILGKFLGVDIYHTEVKWTQSESNHLAVSSVVINLSIFISTPKTCVYDTVHGHKYNLATTFP